MEVFVKIKKNRGGGGVRVRGGGGRVGRQGGCEQSNEIFVKIQKIIGGGPGPVGGPVTGG